MEALNRGDIEEALLHVAEDVTLLAQRSVVEGGYHGHDGVRRFFADTEETFDISRWSYSDVGDLGDRVLAIGTIHLRGREGGVDMDVPTAVLATVEHGKLIRLEDFGDRHEALEAAGNRE